jgi:2-polyprenyl-6-methoxyphenol hydroxylase-like FAD-dependent oxidoreductase
LIFIMAASLHAVVIGASMAGLLAARVLADHVDHVTLIERDDLPDSPDVRSGVPQGRHVHAFLAQGQRVIESFFPGISDELTQAGSPRIRWGIDTAYLTAGGWSKRFDVGIQTNLITRPDLEWRVRRRLINRGGIAVLCRTDVRRLLIENGRVVGVEIASRDTGELRTLNADLVVDVSGRRSRTPEWLAEAGFPTPEETHVNSYLGYATRFYEKPDKEFAWKVLFVNGRPAQGLKRGAGIFEVAGGRWMVTLGGLNKDYPPTDDEGFLEFARSLAAPEIYAVLRDAKPLTPIYGYRVEGSQWRHYERLTRRPERLLIMGDALCAFNPLYGQGMTVAAMEAKDLSLLLYERGRGQWDGLEEAFQKQAAKSIEQAWLMATGEDLRYEGTEGDRPNAFARLAQRYIDRVIAVMPQDEQVTRAFMEVMNLTQPATALFAPHILWRTLTTDPRRAVNDWEGLLVPQPDTAQYDPVSMPAPYGTP